MKYWCVPCGALGIATAATFTVEDELCCATCAPRSAKEAGVDPVPLKNADPVPALPNVTRVGDDLQTVEEEAVATVTQHGVHPKGARIAPMDAKDRQTRAADGPPRAASVLWPRDLPAGADDREHSLKEEPPTMPQAGKLTDQQKQAIRNADPSITNGQLAKKYGVSEGAVWYQRKKGSVHHPQSKHVERTAQKSSRKAAEVVSELPPPPVSVSTVVRIMFDHLTPEMCEKVWAALSVAQKTRALRTLVESGAEG